MSSTEAALAEFKDRIKKVVEDGLLSGVKEYREKLAALFDEAIKENKAHEFVGGNAQFMADLISINDADATAKYASYCLMLKTAVIRNNPRLADALEDKALNQDPGVMFSTAIAIARKKGSYEAFLKFIAKAVGTHMAITLNSPDAFIAELTSQYEFVRSLDDNDPDQPTRT